MNQAQQQLIVLLRCEQRICCPCRTIGIPEPVVIIKLAVLHRLGIRAHVLPAFFAAFAGFFTHIIGIEIQAIEAGVERNQLFFRRTFNFKLAQLVIPQLLCGSLDIVKLSAQLLFKVFLCLLSTDKGSCRAHHDRLRTLSKDCAGVIDCERLIKGAVNVHLRHLVAVRIFVTAEGLRSCIKCEAGHIADINVRRLCVFRISDARDHAVIGRRQFRPDTACRIRRALIKLYAEIVGLCRYIFLIIDGAAICGGIHAGHKSPHRPVSDPDRRLMTAAETSDITGIIVEHRVAGVVFRRPEVEAMRHCDHRPGEASGEKRTAKVVCSAKNVGIVYKRLLAIVQGGDIFNPNRIQRSLEIAAIRFQVRAVCVADVDFFDCLARQRAQLDQDLVFLRIQHGLAFALAVRIGANAILIFQPCRTQIGSIREFQIHCKMHGIEIVVILIVRQRLLRRNIINQPRILRHRNVQIFVQDVVHLRALIAFMMTTDDQLVVFQRCRHRCIFRARWIRSSGKAAVHKALC